MGGGVAGLVTAWLLDRTHDVVLLEAADRLGGHAHSVPVPGGVVDLAAQFVSPAVQPTYWRLAHDVLGMRFLKVRNSASLRDHRCLVDSMRPWRALSGTLALGALTAAGKGFRGSWDVTVDEFVARQLGFLPASLRDDVVLPWLATLNNCDISAIRRTSARAALAFIVRPRQLTYYNAVDGLGSITSRLPVRDVRLSTPVTRVSLVPEGIRLDAASWSGVFDDVVFATPASAARRLLTGALARPLDGFEEMRATLAVHTDPVYVSADRRDWAAYNAVRSGNYCEGSVWYGGLRGSEWPVFKSWTTFRDRQPTETIASAEYRHPVLTPDAFRAQRELRAVQGRDGIWFAGSWTDDVDGQESAVVSALRVAAALGVSEHTLRPLRDARAAA